MTPDFPFGFTPGGGSGGDPRMPFGAGMPFFAELERLLSWQGGPVNWDLAKQVALRAVASAPGHVRASERHAAAEALRIADVWLDPLTTLPAGATVAQAWSRQHWVEVTLPVWQSLCDPVAARVAEAMRTGISSGLSQLGGDAELPPELAGVLPPDLDLSQLTATGGPIMQMMNQVGGMLFGAQVGQAIATLAGEVVSSTEVGLPLGPAGVSALLPDNVAAFGEGLDVSPDEVRIYLALREAASQRLFAHVSWLRAHVLGAVEEYARGIAVDTDAVGRVLRMVDPAQLMNPEGLQDMLGDDVFAEATTPEQKAALARLELALALVEGWVDTVAHAAASAHLPSAAKMREMVRRRRAAGGPGEQTFETLVGLSLRPRKLREAAQLWDALTTARGQQGRDAVWAHPDLLPSVDDLADPGPFVAGSAASGLDDPIGEIEKLRNKPEPPREGTTGDGDGQD